MQKLLLLTTTLFLSFSSLHILAQDKQTLFYDENGKGLDTKKKATFYRLVIFDQNNKPVGIVEDFYMNDKPLAKGEASVIDKYNNHNSRWIGPVKRYDERGRLEVQANYDEFGLVDGIQTSFNSDGVKTEEYEYAHGNPTRDYYLNFDKKGNSAHYSYLTHLPMKLATSDKVIVPFTEKKIIYQDGIPVQFYFIDGLSVAVKVSTKQLYGNYYEAYITLENGSGKQFDFDPSDVTASFEKDGRTVEAEVLTFEDYSKKVKRRQAWSAAFTAFGEFAAATSAGYSSTTLNAHAQSSSGRTVSIHATTTTYDTGAALAASQNAANNMNQLANQQYDIRQNINEGYLKRNTVFPNSRLTGFLNIKQEDADHILINVPVNGKVYHFEL